MFGIRLDVYKAQRLSRYGALYFILPFDLFDQVIIVISNATVENEEKWKGGSSRYRNCQNYSAWPAWQTGKVSISAIDMKIALIF